MSTFVKLTRTGFKGFEDVVVNLDKVTMITPAASREQGSVIWFGKTEVSVTQSLDTIESLIKHMAWPRSTS